MTADPMAGHIRCRSCASAVPVDALPLFQGACPYCLGRPKPYETKTVPAPAALEAQLEKTDRRIRPVDELAPGTPPELVSIIHKCLSHKPGDRYASAAELSEDLRRWRTGHAVDAHSRGILYRAWRLVTRRRWAVAATLLVAAGIALGISAIEAERKRADAALALEVTEKWVELGSKMVARGDDERALDAYTKAIAITKNPATYLKRSFVHWRMMNIQASLLDVLIARGLDPTNSAAKRVEAQLMVYTESH